MLPAIASRAGGGSMNVRRRTGEFTSIMCQRANMSLMATFDPVPIHRGGPGDPYVYRTKWTVDTDAARGPGIIMGAVFRHMT